MDNLYFHFLAYIYPLKSLGLAASWGIVENCQKSRKNKKNSEELSHSFCMKKYLGKMIPKETDGWWL